MHPIRNPSEVADAMSSKGGARELINYSRQDVVKPVDLFDPVRVGNLKKIGESILKLKGRARENAFEALPATDLAAISLMINAVVNYYSAAADTSNIDKSIIHQNESIQLSKYTTDIGARLAELGHQYNEYLASPTAEGVHDNIKTYLGAMPKGEALGNKNLWDDMNTLASRLNEQGKRNAPTQLSYLSFDDGNQMIG